MACKLQGLWRQKKSRENLRLAIRACYQKQFDASSQQWYYCNLRTGAVHWHKPINLGSEDLDDPPDEWVEGTDVDGGVYYFHALTGRYSKLSEAQAAVAVQRLFRKSRSSDFRVKDLGVLAKAVRFQREAKENYFKHPDRLSSIVNYALLNHCITLDWDLARELYGEALERAPQNPVVLLALAVFQVAACAYPRKHTFEQAHEFVKTARVLDPKGEKFSVCRGAFFHFAIVMEPHDPKTLLNWAVLRQVVDGDYDGAETFYRRALECGPNDACVAQNYETFCENRLPGGLYDRG
jgi:tetratricopeptide (TPR) repeat protein